MKILACLLLIAVGLMSTEGQGFVENQLREYYVAAVDIEWDYAPSGKNLIKNTDITEGR